MKLSTETASTNLSGLNWNWTQLASFRAENDVVSSYARSLIIVRPIRRREPCFFTLKFHRSRRLLAVTFNWTIIFITLTSVISVSTYIKTVYWSWVTIRFSVFTKIYSWFTNHRPQIKFTNLSRKSRKLSGPEKPFQKLRSAYSRTLILSIGCVNHPRWRVPLVHMIRYCLPYLLLSTSSPQKLKQVSQLPDFLCLELCDYIILLCKLPHCNM